MNKPLYLCDPEKNESCPKDGCYILGGPCRHTTDKAYEKKQTNQDRIAEMVRTMDPIKLAKILSGEYKMDIIECYRRCPVEKDRGYICPEGKTCFEGVLEWLKEDVKNAIL